VGFGRVEKKNIQHLPLRRARGSVWAVGGVIAVVYIKAMGVGDSIRVGFGKLMGLGY